MWASFSALCEMGVDVDAMTTFGVSPKSLTERPLQEMAESAFAVSKNTMVHKLKQSNTPKSKASSPPLLALEHSLQGTRWNPSPIFCATPTFNESKENPQPYTCGSFFNNATSATSFASLTDENIVQRGPPVALFQTPNLTPIQSNDQTIHSADIKQNLTIPHSVSDSTSSVFQPSFRHDNGLGSITPVARARKIAARLYYDSSPETQPAYQPKTVSKKRQSSSLKTAGERKEEENGVTPNNISNMVPTTKGRVHFEDTDDEINEALPCDEVSERAVKSILDLLCILGTAYKHLCQVSSVIEIDFYFNVKE